ncbi:MAG: DUF4105 domain-containing protein [Bacteroidaceae bacterium]|nr:DUF4105 domain-containing protein [Bacteroidaceae bacterium]
MDTAKRFLLSCIFGLLFFAVARSEVKVSVLTCSPGDEAYALYGHTALRYCDTSRGLDVVFNYGCFDFSTPNFAWRFVLGETDYMVGCTDFSNFLPEYAYRGSGVVEQVIDFTDDEARAIFGELLRNIRPENRVYRYRYLDNNCTTKVRDKLYEVLTADDSVVYKNEIQPGKTYRDALNAPSGEHPWYTFGVNTLLGVGVDKEMTQESAQFLPLDFMNALDGIYIVSANGAERKLVREKNILLDEREDENKVRSNFTPFNASLLLLLGTFIAMLCELRKRRTFWGVDVLLMSVQGLSGALLLFMAIFSEHPAVDVNWLIVLLNPLALVLLPIYVVCIRKHRPMGVAWVQVSFVTLFFLTALFGLQVYPVPMYFCAMALLVRSLFHIYKNKICDLNIV